MPTPSYVLRLLTAGSLTALALAYGGAAAFNGIGFGPASARDDNVPVVRLSRSEPIRDQAELPPPVEAQPLVDSPIAATLPSTPQPSASAAIAPLETTGSIGEVRAAISDYEQAPSPVPAAPAEISASEPTAEPAVDALSFGAGLANAGPMPEPAPPVLAAPQAAAARDALEQVELLEPAPPSNSEAEERIIQIGPQKAAETKPAKSTAKNSDAKAPGKAAAASALEPDLVPKKPARKAKIAKKSKANESLASSVLSSFGF